MNHKSDAGTQIYDSTATYLGMRQGSIASNTNQKIVIYAWAEIPGFSKFGNYTGNLSADGPVVITGFRPKILIIKRYDSSGDNWFIHDAERNKTNVVNARLYPSWSQYEFTNIDAFDFLSNGFKVRTNDTSWNASGGTYIYAAFAESPSFNLYGGQANAR